MLLLHNFLLAEQNRQQIYRPAGSRKSRQKVSIHAPVRGATVMLKIPYTSNTFKQIFANLSFMKLLFRDNRGNNVPNH